MTPENERSKLRVEYPKELKRLIQSENLIHKGSITGKPTYIYGKKKTK